MALFENKTYVNGKEILRFFGVTSETIKDWMMENFGSFTWLLKQYETF